MEHFLQDIVEVLLTGDFCAEVDTQYFGGVVWREEFDLVGESLGM